MRTKWSLLLLVTALTLNHTARAVEPDPIQKVYESLRPEAKEMLQNFSEQSKVEAARKRAAGLPPVSADTKKTAEEGIRVLVYNAMVSKVLCAEEVKAAGQDFEALKKCVAQRTEAMLKYFKMSDYADAMDGRKILKCEMKSRDYKSELRFKPYDFLQNPTSMPLFDFAAMSECVMSSF